MSSLKGMFDRAQQEVEGKVHPLVVTGPHTQWLERPEAEQVYTPAALQFVTAALSGEFAHPRAGRFSPSSIGKCPRRLLFGYAGVPEAGENVDSSDLKGLGKWGHLRWQAEGISMEWMVTGEVWTFDPYYKLGGSIDGVLYDDSLFELKTVFGPKYTRIVQVEQTPDEEHLMQVQVYAETEGATMTSIVYEDRGTGDYHEFRAEPSDQFSRKLHDKLELLNNHREDNTLPPMLEDCERRVGTIFRSCPYRKYCPTATRVMIGS